MRLCMLHHASTPHITQQTPGPAPKVAHMCCCLLSQICKIAASRPPKTAQRSLAAARPAHLQHVGQMQQLGLLVLAHALHWDARPGRHHLHAKGNRWGAVSRRLVGPQHSRRSRLPSLCTGQPAKGPPSRQVPSGTQAKKALRDARAGPGRARLLNVLHCDHWQHRRCVGVPAQLGLELQLALAQQAGLLVQALLRGRGRGWGQGQGRQGNQWCVWVCTYKAEAQGGRAADHAVCHAHPGQGPGLEEPSLPSPPLLLTNSPAPPRPWPPAPGPGPRRRRPPAQQHRRPPRAAHCTPQCARGCPPRPAGRSPAGRWEWGSVGHVLQTAVKGWGSAQEKQSAGVLQEEGVERRVHRVHGSSTCEALRTHTSQLPLQNAAHPAGAGTPTALCLLLANHPEPAGCPHTPHPAPPARPPCLAGAGLRRSAPTAAPPPRAPPSRTRSGGGARTARPAPPVWPAPPPRWAHPPSPAGSACAGGGAGR